MALLLLFAAGCKKKPSAAGVASVAPNTDPKQLFAALINENLASEEGLASVGKLKFLKNGLIESFNSGALSRVYIDLNGDTAEELLLVKLKPLEGANVYGYILSFDVYSVSDGKVVLLDSRSLENSYGAQSISWMIFTKGNIIGYEGLSVFDDGPHYNLSLFKLDANNKLRSEIALTADVKGSDCMLTKSINDGPPEALVNAPFDSKGTAERDLKNQIITNLMPFDFNANWVSLDEQSTAKYKASIWSQQAEMSQRESSCTMVCHIYGKLNGDINIIDYTGLQDMVAEEAKRKAEEEATRKEDDDDEVSSDSVSSDVSSKNEEVSSQQGKSTTKPAAATTTKSAEKTTVKATEKAVQPTTKTTQDILEPK
jgi:hypothetical protein